MAEMRVSCPKCRQTLSIAQALPARVKCPRCDTAFTVNGKPTPATVPVQHAVAAGRAPAGAAVSAPPMLGRDTMPAGRFAPPRGGSGALLWVLVGGGALLALVLVVVVVILLLPKGAADSGAQKPLDDDSEGPPGDRPGLTLNPRAKETNQAIEKGISYLKERLLGRDNLYYFGANDDPNVGAVALAGLTLLECGVPPSDEAVKRATETIRRVRERPNNLRFSYSVALSLLFLDRLTDNKKYVADPRDKALIKSLALQLIAAQHADGGWAYNCQTLTPAEEDNLMRLLQAGNFRPQDFHVDRAFRNYDDNSIAQFATLALWAARRHGVPVEASLLAEEKRYRDSQLPDGSWPYNKKVSTQRDATTCAGLIGLAIGLGIKDEIAVRKAPAGKKQEPIDFMADARVKHGLDYVSKVAGKKGSLTPAKKAEREKQTREMDDLSRQLLTATPDQKPAILGAMRKLDNDELATGILFEADAWGDLYFLWSLERVCMVYDLEKIGGKDWYTWGQDIILANQKPDGSWQERFPGVPDTCFALLFLKRVNVAKDLTDKLRRRGRPGASAPPPGQRPPAPPPRRDPPS